MKLYIDLNHLKSLANSQDEEIRKLIKENFDIFYTFQETEIKKEKRQKIQKIENWQKNLSSGRSGHNIQYNAKIPVIDVEELQSVFFVKDKSCFQTGLMTCDIGDELKTLKNLLIEGKCVPAKFYYTRPEQTKEVIKWEIVSKNVSPCTDIIINDLYFFAQSENEYEYNSYQLIEELCKQSVDQVINIVIVTKLEYKLKEKKGDKLENVTHRINTTAIRKELKRITQQITNHEANVTIVALDEDNSSERIHDRTIFTNYKLFFSGNSFKYYIEKSNQEPEKKQTYFISHGVWLGVCSLFDKDHKMIARRFINDIQDVISNAKKHLIFGSGISNFLNIPKGTN